VLDLHQALRHDLHPCTGVAPSPWRHRHEASGYYDATYRVDHITSHAPTAKPS
jgi:hypothetical protein